MCPKSPDPTANTEYDGLDRLREFRRGVLSDSNRSITGTPNRSQTWTLDALGNWASNTMDGNSTQTRTHNLANEITDLSDTANDPNYDARGNVTADPNFTYKYDAWNRLAEVRKRSDGSLVAAYKYDGANRRIAKLLPNGQNWSRTDYYYNLSWQVLEERYNDSQADANAVATVTRAQYVWDIRYIDAPVVRWWDQSGDGDFDEPNEVLYYCGDFNMNVTALVAPDGNVVERYRYDPYGKVTVMDGDWNVRSSGSAYANEVLFCGYRHDPETGLNQVRYRYLDPTLGRWTSTDPGGYVDGMNLNEYSASCPIGNLDWTGLIRWLTRNKDIVDAFLRIQRDPGGMKLIASIEKLEKGPPPCEVVINIANSWNSTSATAGVLEPNNFVYVLAADHMIETFHTRVVYVAINPLHVVDHGRSIGDRPQDVQLVCPLDLALYHELVHAEQKLSGRYTDPVPKNMTKQQEEDFLGRWGYANDNPQAEYDAEMRVNKEYVREPNRYSVRLGLTDAQRERFNKARRDWAERGYPVRLLEQPRYPYDEYRRLILLQQMTQAIAAREWGLLYEKTLHLASIDGRRPNVPFSRQGLPATSRPDRLP